MNHRNKSSEVPEKDPMGQFFVNMLSDAGFKAVLGDKANKRVLIQTLNHVLPDYARIKDIRHYRDREQKPDYYGGKKTILDLACEGEDGSIFDIEVQQADSPYMFERVVYYAAGNYHAQLLQGNSYERLRPSYSIVFLKEKLWHEQIDTSRHHPVTPALPPDRGAITKEDLLPDSLITRYMFVEEKSRIFAPSSIFCIFAQLGRFNKTLEECSDELEYMLYWFKHSSENETVPEMFADIPFLDELSEATRVAGFSKNKYDIYQSDMKSERDILMMMQDQKEQGRAEGRTEGRAEGRAEERSEIAAKMKSMGLSPEQIAQATDLSIEVINSL